MKRKLNEKITKLLIRWLISRMFMFFFTIYGKKIFKNENLKKNKIIEIKKRDERNQIKEIKEKIKSLKKRKIVNENGGLILMVLMYVN